MPVELHASPCHAFFSFILFRFSCWRKKSMQMQMMMMMMMTINDTVPISVWRVVACECRIVSSLYRYVSGDAATVHRHASLSAVIACSASPFINLYIVGMHARYARADAEVFNDVKIALRRRRRRRHLAYDGRSVGRLRLSDRMCRHVTCMRSALHASLIPFTRPSVVTSVCLSVCLYQFSSLR